MECIECKKFIAYEEAKSEGGYAFISGDSPTSNPYLLITSEIVDPLVRTTDMGERKMVVNQLSGSWIAGYIEERNKSYYIYREMDLLQTRKMMLYCVCYIQEVLKSSKKKWFKILPIKFKLLFGINKSLRYIEETLAKYEDPRKITKEDLDLFEKISSSDTSRYIDDIERNLE